jgi:hypothetical protein
MLDGTLRNLPGHLTVRLDNATCPYCGAALDTTATDEHVVGRRFVPRGKFDRHWNLILRACKPCNNAKADLENDLSAVTMQPNAWGEGSQPDAVLVAEAERKGKHSISRRTGKPVNESSEEITIKVPFGPGVEMTFNLQSPPQVDSSRVFQLARLQLMGFFYWVTFNPETKKGGFWLGDFFPLLEAARADWGNPVHRAFMRTVVGWKPRVLANTAEGFFKAVIRRHPTTVCWSWGVEWNHNFRAVGFFGDREPVLAIARNLPTLEVNAISQGPEESIHYRTEMALSDADDELFNWSGASL